MEKPNGPFGGLGLGRLCYFLSPRLARNRPYSEVLPGADSTFVLLESCPQLRHSLSSTVILPPPPSLGSHRTQVLCVLIVFMLPSSLCSLNASLCLVRLVTPDCPAPEVENPLSPCISISDLV